MNKEIKEISAILRNCEKTLNNASGYNDTTDRIINCLTDLQKENENLNYELKEKKNSLNKYRKFILDLGTSIKQNPEILLKGKVSNYRIADAPEIFGKRIYVTWEIEDYYSKIKGE